jgi:hypothetical protein
MITSSRPSPTKSVSFIREAPLIGSLPAFTQDRLGFLRRLAEEGDACGFHLGPVSMLFFNAAEHVQSILVEYAHEFSKGRLMHKMHLNLLIS